MWRSIVDSAVQYVYFTLLSLASQSTLTALITLQQWGWEGFSIISNWSGPFLEEPWKPRCTGICHGESREDSWKAESIPGQNGWNGSIIISKWSNHVYFDINNVDNNYKQQILSHGLSPLVMVGKPWLRYLKSHVADLGCFRADETWFCVHIF